MNTGIFKLQTRPLAISFPEHARSRVSGGHSSGETNFSRTISYGWRMLLDDYHQIAIHIKCGPTRGLIVFHRNLLKLYTPARLRKLGKFSPRAYIYLILFRWNDFKKSAVESALTKRNLSIALKKEQMEYVSSFVDRRDVLAVLPTG